MIQITVNLAFVANFARQELFLGMKVQDISIVFIAAIGTVLYETRFGGLQDNRQPEMQEFIKAVRAIFETTENLIMLPRWLNKIIVPGKLKRHEDSWDVIFRVGRSTCPSQ